MSLTHLTVAAGLAWALATPPRVQAQAGAQAASPLHAGISLYASASYAEALEAFDAARGTDLAREDRVTLDQHRMLCLLALGRTAAADDAAASLLEIKPDFVLTASDASPRVRARFDETRRRVLPGVVRRVYADAKRAYDGGDFAAARHGFSQIAWMLADPQVAAADPSFADLNTLVDGFLQLSAVAVDRRAPLRDDDTVRAALPVSHTPPPFAPIGIFTYDWRDKDVAPPTAVTQAVTGWWGARGQPPAGTSLGAIEVVVDESGRVADARIYQSVNRVYDAVLLESARHWRYEPAMKGGRAVKYRRIAGIVSGR